MKDKTVSNCNMQAIKKQIGRKSICLKKRRGVCGVVEIIHIGSLIFRNSFAARIVLDNHYPVD